MSSVLIKRKGPKDSKNVFSSKTERSISKNSTKIFRMANPEEDHSSDKLFWPAVILSQIVGLSCLGLVGYWCYSMGGFSWSDPNLKFQFHPMLMVLGLVYFYGDAIIVYRVLHFLPKTTLKIIHGSLHVCAIILSSIGLTAVLQYHWETGKPNFYSLHSWLGIATFSFFLLQYAGSFMAFMFPGLPQQWRSTILPYHVFFGTALFVMAVATCQMGITEKLLWTPGYSDGEVKVKFSVANALGILLIVFALLIVFITTNAKYKRRPLPNELPNAAVN